MPKTFLKYEFPLVPFIIFSGLFVILYISYLLFFIRPQTESAKTLAAAKTELMQTIQPLQQQRLVHTTLLTLDPNKYDFSDDVSVLLQRSKESADKIDGLKPVKLNGAGTKETKALIKEINSDLPKMIDDEKSISLANGKLFENYSNIHATFSKILGYDPAEDFLDLDPSKDSDEISQRAKLASEGLQNFSGKIKSSGLFSDTDAMPFYDKIQSDSALLDQIHAAANSGNSTRTKSLINSFLPEYADLKRISKNLTGMSLKTNPAKETLANETNLINKYQSYIDRIDGLQEKIVRDPLTNIISKFRSLLHSKKTQSVKKK